MKNLVVKEKRSSRPLKLKLNLKRPKKTKNVVLKKKTRNLRRLKWKPTHIAADPPTMPDPISAPCPHEEFHPAPDLSSLQMWEEIKVATKKKFARRGKKHSLGSLEQCFIEFEEDLEELKASYALEYGDQDTNSKGKNCGCCMEVGFEYCDPYAKCKGADFFAYCSDSRVLGIAFVQGTDLMAVILLLDTLTNLKATPK